MDIRILKYMKVGHTAYGLEALKVEIIRGRLKALVVKGPK
jgi:hypothetical protein